MFMGRVWDLKRRVTASKPRFTWLLDPQQLELEWLIFGKGQHCLHGPLSNWTLVKGVLRSILMQRSEYVLRIQTPPKSTPKDLPFQEVQLISWMSKAYRFQKLSKRLSRNFFEPPIPCCTHASSCPGVEAAGLRLMEGKSKDSQVCLGLRAVAHVTPHQCPRGNTKIQSLAR